MRCAASSTGYPCAAVGAGFATIYTTGHGVSASALGLPDAGMATLFVESPESPEELRTYAEAFGGATLLVNMVESGRTPYHPTKEPAKLGFRIALYSAAGVFSAAAALSDAYVHLYAAGSSKQMPSPR